MEFRDADAPFDPKRVQSMIKHASEMFTGINFDDRQESAADEAKDHSDKPDSAQASTPASGEAEVECMSKLAYYESHFKAIGACVPTPKGTWLLTVKYRD